MSDSISLNRFIVDQGFFHIAVNRDHDIGLIVQCDDWRDTFIIVGTEVLMPEPIERQVTLG